jgi:hypothetical protein
LYLVASSKYPYFAIFFFHIQPGKPDIDPWIWIMTGDLPPAYLPLADCESPSEAFEMYVDGMNRWVEFARQGRAGTEEDGVPPVNVPATPKWAEQLHQRMITLEKFLGPIFRDNRLADEAIH